MSAGELVVENLVVRYGGVTAVDGLSLTVSPGQCLALLGANGAGKTSALRGISGLETARGDVRLDGRTMRGWTASRRASAGLGHVLEGRHVFTTMTVAENLAVSARRAAGPPVMDPLELLPELGEHLHRRAGGLSGGQQQMLAIARAVAASPRVLLLDEPTNGLSPKLVDRTIEIVSILRDAGLPILLVEQRLEVAQALDADVIVLRHGVAGHRGPGRDHDLPEILHAAYLS